MSTKTILLVIIGCIVMFGGCRIISDNNSFVSAQESAKKTWAEVQSQYQRRMELIPNLVATVQGVANFEKSTLTAVIEARASATRPEINLSNVDFEKLTPEQIQSFEIAQSNLGSALQRLLVVTEQYPELKANKNFTDLQVEIVGTENRIANARDQYSRVVEPYNVRIRKFPASLYAGALGFEPLPYYEATAGAEKAPTVNFGGLK